MPHKRKYVDRHANVENTNKTEQSTHCTYKTKIKYDVDPTKNRELTQVVQKGKQSLKTTAAQSIFQSGYGMQGCCLMDNHVTSVISG